MTSAARTAVILTGSGRSDRSDDMRLAAGDLDAAEVAHVGIDVEKRPVQRHALPHAHADCGQDAACGPPEL